MVMYDVTSRIYPLSLHDALPILGGRPRARVLAGRGAWGDGARPVRGPSRRTVASGAAVGLTRSAFHPVPARSEEHTSELQSHSDIVCRPLPEKKKTCYQVTPARR